MERVSFKALRDPFFDRDNCCSQIEAELNKKQGRPPPQSVFRRRASSKELRDELPCIEQVLSRDDFDPPITWSMWLKTFQYYCMRLMVLLCFALAFIGICFFHFDQQNAKVSSDTVLTKPLCVSYLEQGNVVQCVSYFLKKKEVNAGTTGSNTMKDDEELKYYPNDERCTPIAIWQTSSRPACNSIHEIDLPIGLSQYTKGRYGLFPVGRGGTRNVWGLESSNDGQVTLKTLRFNRNFDEKRFEEHRFDAMASEQLASNPSVIDIYGFCGHSVLNEYAKGGDGNKLHKKYPDLAPIQKLEHARDLARVIADMQRIDGEDRPSLIHGDLKPCNLMLTSEGKLKLNDFNKGRPLYWNTNTKSACAYVWPNNCGEEGAVTYFRSPEECAHKAVTEKADTYSLGSLFYFLLTGEKSYRLEPTDTMNHRNATQAYQSLNQTEIAEYIVQGKLPHLPEHIGFDPQQFEESKDVNILKRNTRIRRRKYNQATLEHDDAKVIEAIVHAMHHAFTYNAQERPSARWIADYLEDELRRHHDAKGEGGNN
mmetsp:Transcript_9446/g.14041  ORF Transcript_9446/g.14041 Transcript_9446/m.14041 type:complete len:539 (-) Transcript_9446:11-1627(-)